MPLRPAGARRTPSTAHAAIDLIMQDLLAQELLAQEPMVEYTPAIAVARQFPTCLRRNAFAVPPLNN